MTDDRLRKLAFLDRVSAEKERQLGSRRNWRSFTGIGRKWNASWATARIGVLHRGMSAVRNASWVNGRA